MSPARSTRFFRPQGRLPSDLIRSSLAGQGVARRVPAHQSVPDRAGARLFRPHGTGLGRAGVSVGPLGFNVLSFWFPLGFTYEVLRRAPHGPRNAAARLEPRLPGQVRERGARSSSCWRSSPCCCPRRRGWARAYAIFIQLLGLPVSLLSMFVPPIMLFVIPFCGVACCRWLDGASVLDCALN